MAVSTATMAVSITNTGYIKASGTFWAQEVQPHPQVYGLTSPITVETKERGKPNTPGVNRNLAAVGKEMTSG